MSISNYQGNDLRKEDNMTTTAMNNKTSPYLKYAMYSLTREKKYSIKMIKNKQIKVFDTNDLWSKMLQFHKLVGNKKLFERYNRRFNYLTNTDKS